MYTGVISSDFFLGRSLRENTWKQNFTIYFENSDMIRGGSRTAAISKMESFVIIVNG